MDTRRDSRETVMAESKNGGEWRRVVLVEGPPLELMELSGGPATKARYGSQTHGHKMLVDGTVWARMLGVMEQGVSDATRQLFADMDDNGPYLSDLMDLFDRRGEHYAYIAWTGSGDVALRGGL